MRSRTTPTSRRSRAAGRITRAIAAARAKLDAAGIALATFAELVAFGRLPPWMPPTPEHGPDAVTMLMYTSGSTGTPKGALVHEAMCTQFWSGLLPGPAAVRPALEAAT